MTDCITCKEWGSTVERYATYPVIECPNCKRPTWPNLGVNCPAGCAVSFATGNSAYPLSCLSLLPDAYFYLYQDPALLEFLERLKKGNK